MSKRRKFLAIGCTGLLLLAGVASAWLAYRLPMRVPRIEVLSRGESKQRFLTIRCLEYWLALDDLTIVDPVTGAFLLRAKASKDPRPIVVPFDPTADLATDLAKHGWLVDSRTLTPVALRSGARYRVTLTGNNCFEHMIPTTSELVVGVEGQL